MIKMTPGSSAWDKFFGHYPVLFKNGAEVVKINPNNFGQDINGNTIDITSGDAGDVMIAFPRHGLKMSKSGNIVTISMTNDPDNSSFKYYAHSRGSTLKDKFYVGAYEGSNIDDKLRSLSGQKPFTNKIIGNIRTSTRANTPASDENGGSGYDMMSFYPLTYLQAMYCLKYKNLNSQSAVGMGWVDQSGAATTGGTNTKGMDWGETTGKEQMKLFGIEDFWGNIAEWIDGAITDSNTNLLTATQGFNDAGEGYTNQGQLNIVHAENNVPAWITKVKGTTEKGFITTAKGGSETTYYCDTSNVKSLSVGVFGEYYIYKSRISVFTLNLSYNTNIAMSYIGTRLMYL